MTLARCYRSVAPGDVSVGHPPVPNLYDPTLFARDPAKDHHGSWELDWGSQSRRMRWALHESGLQSLLFLARSLQAARPHAYRQGQTAVDGRCVYFDQCGAACQADRHEVVTPCAWGATSRHYRHAGCDHHDRGGTVRVSGRRCDAFGTGKASGSACGGRAKASGSRRGTCIHDYLRYRLVRRPLCWTLAISPSEAELARDMLALQL